MGKQTEYLEAMEAFKAEAMKNAVRAFDEGYLLGRKHAKEVYGGDDEN